MNARTITEVAVGVLLRPDRAVLLADRPHGKPYPGYWEFPGGKIEPGESVEHALQRELHEELGVEIVHATPWVTFEFDYPHAYVRLHFCRVYDWRGTPHGREGQRVDFFRIDRPPPAPLLPAAVPALKWLALPEIAGFSCAAELGVDGWLPLLERRLAAGLRLVILDEPEIGRSAHEALIGAVAQRARAAGALVFCSRDAVDLDGRLYDALELRGPARRPSVRWAGAMAVERASIDEAARIGLDFVIAGPVLPREGQAPIPTIGWHGAAAMAAAPPLPVYLYGGLTPDDLPHARAVGAHGIVIDR